MTMTQTATIAREDVQGFITSGYGHTFHAAYLFLKVLDKSAAKKWLTDLIPQVQTAESWRPTPDAPKQEPKTIVNIAFTLSGLQAFGLPDSSLKSFPAAMQEGMTQSIRSQQLGDTEESSPALWHIGGTTNPTFDMVLLLYAGENIADTAAIDALASAQIDAATNGGLNVVHDERGYRRDDEKEPFGFRDGISQPKIEGINKRDSSGIEYEKVTQTGEFILGYKNAYNLYPTVPVVADADDPNNLLPKLDRPRDVYPLFKDTDVKDLGKHGTFLVYRKLYQSVAAFWNFLGDEVERLYGTRDTNKIIWMAAKFVGRWPDGTPLVPNPEKLRHNDAFLYADTDPDGMHCPFGSHLRRSNPRDLMFPTDDEGLYKEASLVTSSKHRILRRGRVFGDELFDIGKLDGWKTNDVGDILQNLQEDGKPRGFHFFAVNANIQRQFEFIQNSWANNPSFNAMYQNKDPLMGDNARTGQAPSYMKIPADPVPILTSPVPRFIAVRGGAYFFMPGISALKYIAQV